MIDITVTEMLSDRSPDWIENMWMNIYLVTVLTNAIDAAALTSAKEATATTGTVRNCNHAHKP